VPGISDSFGTSKPATIVWIPLTALAVLAAVILVKNNLIHLPFWQTIENLWIIRQLGPLGTSAFLIFLVGITITLSLAPILIFESGTKQTKYYLN
jgi:hypothetical protein